MEFQICTRILHLFLCIHHVNMIYSSPHTIIALKMLAGLHNRHAETEEGFPPVSLVGH